MNVLGPKDISNGTNDALEKNEIIIPKILIYIIILLFILINTLRFVPNIENGSSPVGFTFGNVTNLLHIIDIQTKKGCF